MIGITNGAFIALIALGYTLVYGIIELINFAHGDLFMLGTFACLTTLTLLGFSTEVGTTGTPWFALLLAMLAAMIFCGLLNVLAERIAYSPPPRAPHRRDRRLVRLRQHRSLLAGSAPPALPRPAPPVRLRESALRSHLTS